MKLTVSYEHVSDQTGTEQLEYLEFMNDLPTWAYTRHELAEYKTKKYKLLGEIRKEQEYENACKQEFDNSSG